MNREEHVAYLKEVLATREDFLARCLARKLSGAMHLDGALDLFLCRVNETKRELRALGVNPDEPDPPSNPQLPEEADTYARRPDTGPA
jgi:hypothetical protein